MAIARHAAAPAPKGSCELPILYGAPVEISASQPSLPAWTVRSYVLLAPPSATPICAESSTSSMFGLIARASSAAPSMPATLSSGSS